MLTRDQLLSERKINLRLTGEGVEHSLQKYLLHIFNQ